MTGLKILLWFIVWQIIAVLFVNGLLLVVWYAQYVDVVTLWAIVAWSYPLIGLPSTVIGWVALAEGNTKTATVLFSIVAILLLPFVAAVILVLLVPYTLWLAVR